MASDGRDYYVILPFPTFFCYSPLFTPCVVSVFIPLSWPLCRWVKIKLLLSLWRMFLLSAFSTAIQRAVGHWLCSQAVWFRLGQITQPDPRGQWESSSDRVRGDAVVQSSRDPAGIHEVSTVMSICYQYLYRSLCLCLVLKTVDIIIIRMAFSKIC